MSIIETVEELDSQKLLNKPSYFAKKLLGVEPFEYQKDFIDADNRKKVCRAGRQVGKSRCVAWIALHKALMEPPADVIITAEAQRQARELINQIKSELSESPIEHSQWGIDRGVQMTIEFDQGSRIIALPTGRSGAFRQRRRPAVPGRPRTAEAHRPPGQPEMPRRTQTRPGGSRPQRGAGTERWGTRTDFPPDSTRPAAAPRWGDRCGGMCRTSDRWTRRSG